MIALRSPSADVGEGAGREEGKEEEVEKACALDDIYGRLQVFAEEFAAVDKHDRATFRALLYRNEEMIKDCINDAEHEASQEVAVAIGEVVAKEQDEEKYAREIAAIHAAADHRHRLEAAVRGALAEAAQRYGEEMEGMRREHMEHRMTLDSAAEQTQTEVLAGQAEFFEARILEQRSRLTELTLSNTDARYYQQETHSELEHVRALLSRSEEDAAVARRAGEDALERAAIEARALRMSAGTLEAQPARQHETDSTDGVEADVAAAEEVEAPFHGSAGAGRAAVVKEVTDVEEFALMRQRVEDAEAARLRAVRDAEEMEGALREAQATLEHKTNVARHHEGTAEQYQREAAEAIRSREDAEAESQRQKAALEARASALHAEVESATQVRQQLETDRPPK